MYHIIAGNKKNQLKLIVTANLHSDLHSPVFQFYHPSHQTRTCFLCFLFPDAPSFPPEAPLFPAIFFDFLLDFEDRVYLDSLLLTGTTAATDLHK